MSADKLIKCAVVIPCYKVANNILNVIKSIGPEIKKIYVIDDACPENSGILVKNRCLDKRVSVLYNKKNLGVGASTKKGFHEAFKEDDIDVCIKIDGDGQMDTKNIPKFLNPFEINNYIYVKGNRFHFHKNFLKMPIMRVFGNFFLSYISKITTGQYNTFDVNNGFIALHKDVYTKINFLNISDNYFFETSMVAEMRKIRCRIVDIKIDTIYDKEISNLKINKILFNFILNHFLIFVKRILNEYLRSKNYLIIYLIIGIFISIIIPISTIHKITLLITLILVFLYKDKNFVNFKE